MPHVDYLPIGLGQRANAHHLNKIELKKKKEGEKFERYMRAAVTQAESNGRLLRKTLKRYKNLVQMRTVRHRVGMSLERTLVERVIRSQARPTLGDLSASARTGPELNGQRLRLLSSSHRTPSRRGPSDSRSGKIQLMAIASTNYDFDAF
ncbi:hypothetical protein B0H17DRAFT_1142019 [Mycena rosella]|uniref:Uncharacterized protein n=1 Tax=Mycena rosella TaxID=1033263 RepID=A0AAD7CYM5_MYCRO|nr:hypothetical protein B0H17DRAFT_1142019 [Mycena rosella]